jgi:hypothetical protein
MQQATTIAFFFRLMRASRLHAVFLVIRPVTGFGILLRFCSGGGTN